VVGTVVALFALNAQIISPALNRARKTLSYRVLYDGPPNREMQANEQAITTENARLVDIKLENHGTIDIERSHFERPITFSFGTAAKVLYAEVVEEAPEGITVSLQTLPDKVQFNPVLLNKGDSIRFVVFLSDANSEEIKVDGRIVGVSTIVDRTLNSVRETYARSAAVLLGALLIMILAATAETLGWLSIDLALLSYLSLGLVGGLVTFSLVLLLIERRTKGKRREFASRVLKAFGLRLPERGGLYFQASNFDFNWVLDPNEPVYTFSIAGFNDRAEDIEVLDVEVVFLRGDVQVAKDRPRDRVTGYRIDRLNFPSREWRVQAVEAGGHKVQPRGGARSNGVRRGTGGHALCRW